MFTNTFFKSLLNGVLAWLILAVLFCLFKGGNFGDMLLKAETIIPAVSAFAASCVGFMAKEKKAKS